MPNFKVLKISDKIYHLRFKTQHLLNSTLLRFSEYMESPKFRLKKGFTLEDFSDWYAQENKNFDYYQVVYGHNFPSKYLKPFYDGKFNPLSKKEQEILNKFNKIKDADFYIIGTHKEDKLGKYTLKHETAHALFYTDPNYKKQVLTCMKQLNPKNRNKLEKWLKKKGYHRAVFNDEIHAYLVENFYNFYSKKNKNAKFVSTKLRKIYKKYV